MKKKTITTAVAIVAFTGTIYLSSCGNGENKDDEKTEQQPMEESHPSDASMQNNSMMKTMNDMMERMNQMQMTGDFDHDFAVMMIDHHQGAIDMEQIEVSSGKDDKLKSMAEKMMTAQKAEQEKLRAFVSGHAPKADKSHDAGHSDHNELKEAMDKMMEQMKSMQMTGDVDNDFAMMMIPHHQSGIDMSKNELSHGKVLEIKQMAQKMIADQNKEIKELQDWLAKNK